jgi:predicted metal-dependent phosphoesterase TrpH
MEESLAKDVVCSIDLHTHSTASDGQLTPQALVEKAASLGICTLALTDHDSVSGIDEAWSAAKRLGITFIPGVELSTDWAEGECHILGYYLDHRDSTLREALSRFQQSRRDRGQMMVQRLRELGLPITWERVQELAGNGTITRAHIADALLEAGCVSARREAFEHYIGRGGPAYVLRYKLSPEDAVSLIREARGVPVLAHPTFAAPERDWTADPDQLVPWPFLGRLQERGLLGLEAYYSEYSIELSTHLVGLADLYGLIVTGGSDFHGIVGGPALGSAPVPSSVLQDLRHLAKRSNSPWIEGKSVSVGHRAPPL